MKVKIRNDFGNVFTTDADFVAAKVYSICSQGIRFRLERSKGLIKTRVLLISKKCGLIKPEFFVSDIKSGLKECVIFNNSTIFILKGSAHDLLIIGFMIIDLFN